MAFHVCYDGGHFCDGFDVTTLEGAKASCMAILTGWISSFNEQHKVTSVSDLLADQVTRDAWDDMIEECCVYVCDSEDPDWYSCWSPSDDDLQRIGWMYTDDMTDGGSHDYVSD